MNLNKNNSLTDFILLATLICLGFYGGTGFFTLVGFNPAMMKMSSATFAEHWQHIDFYMGARMKFFGPTMLLLIIVSVVVLFRKYSKISFLLMALALVVLIADLIVGVTFNAPLNTLIQNWDLNDLPNDVQEIKYKVVSAFWVRSACMITAFIFGLLAFWRR
jgi:uncharacterized membrane protein